MPTVTVENLAKIIGSESGALFSQMKEAGLSHTDISDEVTDQDKKTLLEFLKNQQTKIKYLFSMDGLLHLVHRLDPLIIQFMIYGLRNVIVR